MGCIVSSSAVGGDLKKKNRRAKKTENQNCNAAPKTSSHA